MVDTTGTFWNSQREQDVALHIGFRVRAGRIEHLSQDCTKVRAVSPAHSAVQALWDALMTPEADWGERLRAVS